MEAQVSSHSPSFLLKVGHFSHLLWLRCCAVQWRFRWLPLPNLKLLEFFSFSPLSPCRNAAFDDDAAENASAKQSEERGEKGLPLRRP